MRKRHGILMLALMTPLVLAVGGWADLGGPAGGTGLLAFAAFGLLAGTILPGLLVSAAELPLVLIPRPLLRAHRCGKPRPAIHAWLRRAVYAADRHRCAYCHARVQLQFDHIRPWASGGLSVLWNGMTLCAYHNHLKSNYWRDRDGYVHYRGFVGSENAVLAASILAFELRHRWSPARWVRAGLSLAA